MRIFATIALILSGLQNPLYSQTQTGIASVRPLAHEGVFTETGARFSHDSLVASHRRIPFGSIVKVTNMKNRKSVQVTINDRGPFINGHIIDLSEKAGLEIGLGHNDLAKVKVDIIDMVENYTFKNIESNSEGEFSIKVGSFGNKDNANTYATNLTVNMEIKDVIIKEVDNIYKVYIGRFSSRDLAEKFKTTLPKDLQNSYVTTFGK